MDRNVIFQIGNQNHSISVIFAVDEHNHPRILKIEPNIDCMFTVSSDDINRLESHLYIDGEDYSMTVNKGSLVLNEKGHWELSVDSELICDLSDD